MHARLLSVAGALLMVLVGAACAKGTTLTGIGGSGAEGASGPTSSSASSASSSGNSTSSSTSSSGSTSTSSSTSASSAGCPSPCKVTNPQCGCAPGEACTVEQGSVGCGQAGSDAVDQACGTSASDLCQAGLACVTASTSVGQCLEFCDTDSDCASLGGICVIQLDDGTGMGTSIPGVTLCTPGCDPISAFGCPATSSCELGRENGGLQRWFGICGPAGNKTQGQSCNSSVNDCSPGYTCIDPDGTSGSLPYECLRYCDADSFGCPGGLSCYPLQDQNTLPIVVGGVTMGVCF